MALTKVQTIGIETGISLTGVTSAVNLNVTGITTVGVVSATSLNVSGVITATNFVGSGSQLTGVASTDNIRTNTNATFLQNINVTGIVTAAGVNASGVVTATSFSGSGANLTGLAATANITTSSLVVIGVSTVAAGSTAAPSISPTGDSDTGIFFPSADTIAFGEGGSEAARIDSSSRLLIGTSSARNWAGITGQFLLEGTSYNSSSPFFIANSNDNYGAFLLLGKTRGTSVGSNTVVQNNDYLGEISFAGGDGSALRQGAGIAAYVDGTPGANDMPGRLLFSLTADGASSPTERMRISNNGVIDCFVSGGEGFALHSAQSAGNSLNFFVGYYGATGINGTASYVVRTNGNVLNTNGSYTAISDQKLKENIVDANSQWTDLKAIKIRNWNFKEETGHETHRQIGPIAQELEQVCPGLVFEIPEHDVDGEAIKGVNQSILYMKAVKALQEAMERIETLEAKVAALESA